MWIKIFPLDPEVLDKEAKEEELAPILLNLDRLILVELNIDYLTLYLQEMDQIIIRANSNSAASLIQAIRLQTAERTDYPETYLDLENDEDRDEDE